MRLDDWLSSVFSQTKPDGQNLRFDCPICMGSAGHSRLCASVHLRKQVWRCFQCEASGSALGLVQYVEGCTREQALDVVDFDENALQTSQEAITAPKTVNLPPEYRPMNWKAYKRLGRLGKRAHDYAKSRGWDEKVCQTYVMGYCVTGRYRGRIIIPFHSPKGKRIIGFQGRTFMDDEPRYLGPSVPHTVFNLHRQKDKDVVLVHEGPADAIATGGVALCGSHLTWHQLDLLVRLRKPLILWLDNDAKQKAVDMAAKMCKHTLTYVYIDHKAKDAGDNPDEIHRVRQRMVKACPLSIANLRLRLLSASL